MNDKELYLDRYDLYRSERQGKDHVSTYVCEFVEIKKKLDTQEVCGDFHQGEKSGDWSDYSSIIE